MVCQVLPAIGVVSILELAATTGSSRMSQAPNLQLAMQLLTSAYLCQIAQEKSCDYSLLIIINMKNF